MLVQEVKPFDYALDANVFDRDILKYYNDCIYKIMMGHIIY